MGFANLIIIIIKLCNFVINIIMFCLVEAKLRPENKALIRQGLILRNRNAGCTCDFSIYKKAEISLRKRASAGASYCANVRPAVSSSHFTLLNASFSTFGGFVSISHLLSGIKKPP